MKKPDIIQKAIKSIGKRTYPAFEADKKLARMSEQEKFERAEEVKNAKINPSEFIGRGGEKV